MSTGIILNPERVKAIFTNCLFRDGEDTSQHVEVEGITSNVVFNPQRLNSHNAEIVAMLDELPKQFHQEGGSSFLDACVDKHGNQWTGFHQRMEQLFQLGIAIGKVKSVLPRDMRAVIFPRGIPYYTITP